MGPPHVGTSSLLMKDEVFHKDMQDMHGVCAGGERVTGVDLKLLKDHEGVSDVVLF